MYLPPTDSFPKGLRVNFNAKKSVPIWLCLFLYGQQMLKRSDEQWVGRKCKGIPL